ncbi:hypothetical protein [uncultured Sphaerochaeta sp.]|uniref:hypothetical protein n=1 Tax=uncultured Sphaerochaeta sp. TaxID=886478 RepID=UPI002623E02C|nr:hypothetical protein [uncultured Sphaerochaeta sp.]
MQNNQIHTYFFSVFLRLPTRYQHVILKTGNLAHEPYPPAKEPDVWNIGVDPEDDWFDKNLPAVTENPVFTALPIPEPDLRRVNPLGMRGSHVFPTDHIYLEPIILKTIQVFGYAPAAGKIHSIEESSSIHGDTSIRVAV